MQTEKFKYKNSNTSRLIGEIDKLRNFLSFLDGRNLNDLPVTIKRATDLMSITCSAKEGSLGYVESRLSIPFELRPVILKVIEDYEKKLTDELLEIWKKEQLCNKDYNLKDK